MKILDNFLNQITMYRLVLYYLIFLIIAALLLCLFGLLPFTPFALIFSSLFLVAICWTVNTFFAKLFKVPTNVESVFITSLILTLIITPSISIKSLIFLLTAATVAMASKYLFVINKKHLFNPSAIAVVITSLTISQAASWWVGNLPMLPALLIGLLVIKKIKRFSLVLSFLSTYFILTFLTSLLNGGGLTSLQTIIINPQIIFFATIMLVEPLTSPTTRKLQIVFGTLVGLLLSLPLQFGSFYMTPEIALILGNIYAFIVSPKYRLILKLKEKISVGQDLYDFIFLSPPVNYQPGQYMEWTLPHHLPDSRGNRRFFTLASSPTENSLRIGVKFFPSSSSFKQSLQNLKPGGQIIASQLSGEFTLPKDLTKKLVFIAGGIGVTPFRSIIKYLLDKNEKRDITLFYSVKTIKEAAYQDLFIEAEKKLGIKTIINLTDLEKLPPNWTGQKGTITDAVIKSNVPDYKERIFYLSGPHAMVDAFEVMLKQMGIPGNQIKTDYFPGYA